MDKREHTRAVEAERLRQLDAAHAKRTMLERDHPALAAVVAAAPGDDYFLNSAVALVSADDYRTLGAAMDTFGPSSCWTGITLPDPGVAVTPFITEDTDARELAGVIRAYVERAEAADLAVVLAAAHAAGWRAPADVFDGAADDLADGYAAAVHGGDDDYDVAEAAALAVARYGILDDDHRPDDYALSWEAHVVPGVPVWLPHVEAWRKDMDHDMDTLTMRQMDRAVNDWEDWGQDTYLCAYAEAYVEAILDAETPATVGEDWDSGVDPADRAEEARERAQAVVDELDVGLSDLGLDCMVPTEEDITKAATSDAQFDYRESVRATRATGMSPLF